MLHIFVVYNYFILYSILNYDILLRKMYTFELITFCSCFCSHCETCLNSERRETHALRSLTNYFATDELGQLKDSRQLPPLRLINRARINPGVHITLLGTCHSIDLSSSFTVVVILGCDAIQFRYSPKPIFATAN